MRNGGEISAARAQRSGWLVLRVDAELAEHGAEPFDLVGELLASLGQNRQCRGARRLTAPAARPYWPAIPSPGHASTRPARTPGHWRRPAARGGPCRSGRPVRLPLMGPGRCLPCRLTRGPATSGTTPRAPRMRGSGRRSPSSAESASVHSGGSGVAVAPHAVTFRDRVGCLRQFLIASGQIQMTASTRTRRRIEQPEESEMLASSCRNVLIESGR